MATFLSLFTAAQITRITERSEITERVAPSTTGQLVPADDLGEIYLDDPNALFLTAAVEAGDIVEITAGPITPLGHYTVAGQYFDPKVDASVHVPFETRLILDGFPTVGGPITYRILTPTELLEELATITETRSFIENVSRPELQLLDDIFTIFFDKFDIVCDLTADVHRWLAGLDRSRIDPAAIALPAASVINNSAAVVSPTVLFPQLYFELRPNRTSTAFLDFPNPVDPFTIVSANSEREGVDDEISADPPSPGPELDSDYTDALNMQDNALDMQDAALALLEAEILDNDAPGESGDLSAFYLAIKAVVLAQRASIVLRKQDIADMFSQDRPRLTAAGLNFATLTGVGSIDEEVDARIAELTAASFQAFLDLRFTYLDLLSNRSFGTRADLFSLDRQVALGEQHRQTLLSDLTTERDLLGLP